MVTPVQEKKPSLEEPRSVKSYIIESVISLLIVVALCVTTGLVDVYGRQIDFALDPLRVLGDSFGAGGLLCFSFWGLLWVSSEGAFDIIVYGVRKVFNVTFQNLMKNSALPDSYTDYVAMKRAKKHDHHIPFFVISLVFFLVGLILSLCAI